MNRHCAMDNKETAEKRKGEGKGPDVAHSLKLWLFVRLFSVHVLQDHINFTALFAQLTGIYNRYSLGTLRTNTIYPCCVLTWQYLILYVCSAQNHTNRMTTEEERLARLRRVLHSLATRVPKVILTRVESTFPVLKNQAVSVKHSIMYLYQ
jgi:hypothetical protein